jgi:hypothetical protein
MMKKFLRSYELSIQGNDRNFLTLKPPFTVSFDIIRNVLTSANTFNFRVYNLSENHRRLLQKNVTDFGNNRFVYFRAGYGENLSLIFSGNITQGFSVREGTNFITSIDAFDGGFAFITAMTNLSFPAGTERKDIIKAVVATLPNVSIGAVGNAVTGAIPRGNSYKGASTEILAELTGNGFFIDNGKAYVLADNECLEPNGIVVIDPSVGLLNTPERDETNMRFDMIFEPKLQIGQKVSLKSVTEKYLNGDYKVISLHHRGLISEATCGEAVTTVGLMAPYAGIEFAVIPGEAA